MPCLLVLSTCTTCQLVQLVQLVKCEEENLIEKLPSSDLPVGVEVVHFLDL